MSNTTIKNDKENELDLLKNKIHELEIKLKNVELKDEVDFICLFIRVKDDLINLLNIQSISIYDHETCDMTYFELRIVSGINRYGQEYYFNTYRERQDVIDRIKNTRVGIKII